MLQLALRGVRNNPFRYAATSIAIILGVAFFVTTGVMTTSFRTSINSVITESYEGVDVLVQSSETIDTGPFEFRQKIPAELTDSIKDVPGVKATMPYIWGYAQVLTTEGKAIPNIQQSSGAVWSDSPDLSQFDLIDGAAPQAANEIAIDTNSFDKGDFTIGQQVRLLPLPADSEPFTIVGTIELKVGASSRDAYVSFTEDAATQIFGSSDADGIYIAVDDGYTDEEVIASLQPIIDTSGDQLEAVTSQQLVDDFEAGVDTITNVIDITLKVFAGVSLFVGAFVIYNTFSIIIAQRTKEMALLRAIGATGAQVSRSVLVEAIVIGMLASLVGVLAGIAIAFGLLKLLASLVIGFDIGLSIPPGSAIWGVLIGTIITIASAWLPARRGARIAPIEALRDSQIEEVRAGKARKIVGLAMGAGGLLLAVLGVDLIGNFSPLLLAFGVPMMVIAIFLVAPLMVRPVTQVLAIPLVRNGKITGSLARENAVRNPKRTATTSLTLMIGVMLMVTAAVFAATASNSVRGSLEERLLATDVVTISQNVQWLGGGMDPSIASSIAAIDGVEAAMPVRTMFGETSNDFITISGIDAATIPKVLDLEMVAGSIADVGAGTMAVNKNVADSRDLTIGDTISTRFTTETAEFKIVAIFKDETDVVNPYIVDNATLGEYMPKPIDTEIFVNAVDSETVDAAIDKALADDPTAELKSKSQFITDQASAFNTMLYVLYGLLGMAVVVALVGIVNTMALSIHERTRELGLLRAVGMTQRQLKRTVRFESALVALMGTSVGIGLGLFFGWLTYKSAPSFLTAFVIPWGQLLVVLIIGLVSGVIAGLMPARRAAKLNVLEAIAME